MHQNQDQTTAAADQGGTPDYRALVDVLDRAAAQAIEGKGAARHAQGRAYNDQPMQHLLRLYGPGFALGQAAKKSQEAMRLPTDHAVAELLGAINYLAGAVIHLEAMKPTANADAAPVDPVARRIHPTIEQQKGGA